MDITGLETRESPMGREARKPSQKRDLSRFEIMGGFGSTLLFALERNFIR